MKKIFLTLTSAMLLTGCNIKFLNTKYPEGFSNGSAPDTRVVEYYNGDTFSTEDLTAKTLVFIPDEAVTISDANNKEDVIKMIDPESTALGNIENIEDFAYVGRFHGLKLGSPNGDADGHIKFTFDKDVKFVEINAMPRYNKVYSGPSETEVIDHNLAIKANDCKYIKVDSDFGTISDIEESTLKFDLRKGEEFVKYLELNVVYERVEITSINIYFKD